MATPLVQRKERLERIHPGHLALVLFVILACLSLPLYNRLYSNGLVDMGEYLNNPVRILHGELPYRDFWLFHPPGEVFLPCFLYRLFGLQINNVLMVSVLMNVVVGVLSFVLAQRFLKENTLALLVGLLVFFNGVPTVGSMEVIQQTGHYLLFLMAAALALVRFAETGSALALCLSGVAIGCGFWVRLYDTLPAFVAFVLAIVLSRDGTMRISADVTLKRVSLFLVGAVGAYWVLTLPVLPMWQPSIWKPMLRELVVRSVQYYAQTYHDTHPWTHLVDQVQYVVQRFTLVETAANPLNMLKLVFRTLSLVNTLALYVLPLLVGVLAISVMRRSQLTSVQRTMLIAFLGWGMLALAKTWKYPVTYYWMFGTTPLLFVFGFLLQRIHISGAPWLRRLTWGMMVVLLCSIPSSIGVAAFRMATVNEPITGPHGSILVEDAPYVARVRRVIAILLGGTKEQDYVFVEPFQIPPLYAMTGRRNPTYYDSLQVPYVRHLAGLPTEPVEEELCRELTSRDTRMVVTEATSIANYHVLHGCIEGHFDLFERVGPYTVYAARRKSSPHT